MSQEDIYFDEDDKKLYLALQKAGELIPCDVDEVLDDEEDCSKLPRGLQDVDAAVKKIMSGGAFNSDNVIPLNSDTEQDLSSDSEWAMAARHGAKLSDASREKIRKIRESRESNE
jgi:hypothetical protein